jgi:hypothetical protein
MVVDPSNPDAIVSAEGDEADRQLWVDASGGIVEVAFAESAMTAMDEFINALHGATLRLRPAENCSQDGPAPSA